MTIAAMYMPPFTSIAEHRERRIACESLSGLLADSNLLPRQRLWHSGNREAAVFPEDDPHDPQRRSLP